MAGIMKAKVKLGMGLSTKNKRGKQEQQIIKKCRNILEKTEILAGNTPKNIQTGIEILHGYFTSLKKRSKSFQNRCIS